jgi:putative ABC transport system substrate-binding protein
MVDDRQQQRGGDLAQVNWHGRLWPLYIAFIIFLISSILLGGGTYAAKRDRPFLIGALTASWGPTPHIPGLRDGLIELGYREYKQFDIGVRFTKGNIAALPEAARQLVQHGVDIIFAAGAIDVAKAAQTATTQVPIVFASAGGDPTKSGLIQSFARPGGNTTGVTGLGLELSPKRLEMFHELIPGLKRVLFLYDANHGSSVAAAKAYRGTARRLGMVLVERAVRTEQEAQTALAQLQKEAVDGILQPPGVSLNISGFILEAAAQRRLPTMAEATFWVERGALVSYGPDYYASGRQAARLVDKILKGADPAEIPVEVNSKIEFAINLKTAKALGLTIPPEVLYQANRIVR